MTSQQLKLIHLAYRQAKLTEGQYRIILANTAGVESAKELDNVGFEDVMAVIEDSGFADTKGSDYWRDKVRRRGCEPGARMRRKILMLAQDCKYPLGALVRRFSDKRTDDVEQLYPREAWKLIEGLKAMVAREPEAVQVPLTK
jgi:hypothetical protein